MQVNEQTHVEQTFNDKIGLDDCKELDGEDRYVLSPTWLRRHPIYSLNYIVVSREFVLYQSQLIIISLQR